MNRMWKCSARLGLLPVGVVACLATSVPVMAYELATHARISYEAMQRFSSSTGFTLNSLGLSANWSEPLDPRYIDVQGEYAIARMWKDFDWDRDKMPRQDSQGTTRRLYLTSPQYWLMAGAAREDDVAAHIDFLNHGIFDTQKTPLDDPYGDFDRFCNHFFDPYHNRALTRYCSSGTITSAPIWALGLQEQTANIGGITVPLSTEPIRANRMNHFSIPDAHEAFWRALTLSRFRDSTRSLMIGSNGTFATVPAPELGPNVPPFSVDRVLEKVEHRMSYFATGFRALGNTIHLLTDMAQPSHTRNESHGFWMPSWYEKYIDARAKGEDTVELSFSTGTVTENNLQPLTFLYVGYPPPTFNNYSDYWSTGYGNATFDGMGLADYSRRCPIRC